MKHMILRLIAIGPRYNGPVTIASKEKIHGIFDACIFLLTWGWTSQRGENTWCFQCMYLLYHMRVDSTLVGFTLMWEGGCMHRKYHISPRFRASIYCCMAVMFSKIIIFFSFKRTLKKLDFTGPSFLSHQELSSSCFSFLLSFLFYRTSPLPFR